MRKLVTLGLVCTLWLLAVPSAATGWPPPPSGKICVINTPGGDEDLFNLSTAEGIRRASWRFNVETLTLDAEDEEDIQDNIEQCLADDCDLIIGVGRYVAMLMEPHIAANPGQLFAVLDEEYENDYANAAEVWFRSDQAAFLAAYAAAAYSRTGIVGLYGGIQIPQVTSFMDGYALGVEYYNDRHGASVEVLGWDPYTQGGIFVGTFNDPVVGYDEGRNQMEQGADVIFPVAGSTGLGTLEASRERRDAGGSYALLVGVDVDWQWHYERGYRFLDRLVLTSAIKDFGEAAFDQIAAWKRGTWVSGLVDANLANGGVDIVFRSLLGWVDASTLAELWCIRWKIMQGEIATTP